MYATVENVKQIKEGHFRFSIFIYDDDDRKLFGFNGNRIFKNHTTNNINLHPASSGWKNKYYQIGFISHTIWPRIADAINKIYRESNGDESLLNVAKERIAL